MRAAIYCRVSTTKQGRDGISLEMQREQCLAAAERDGHPTVEVFEETQSGTKADNRKVLQELLRRLADFDAVYCAKLDRMARSAGDFDRIVKRFLAAGVRLVFLQENFDLGTAQGRAFAGMVAVFAQLEAEMIRERTLEAFAQLRKHGRRLGGIPFGYMAGETKEAPMLPDPEQAPIVREVFTRYAAGESITSLMQWMNANGVKGQRGGKWYMFTVTNMLANPAYMGYRRTAREGVLPGSHEPLITAEVWRKAQERLKENAFVRPASRNRSLTPVYRCGVCGGRVRRQYAGKGNPQLACAARSHLPPEQRHPPVYQGEAKIVALTWRAVEYFIGAEAIAEGYRRHQAKATEGERQRLQERRDKLQQDLAYNLAAARAGAISVSLLAQENAPLNAELEDLDRTLAELDAGSVRLTELQAVTPEQVVAMMQEQDTETQRRFLLRFFERVELHKGRLRFVPTIAEIEPFDVAVPPLYQPNRGGKNGTVAFRLLT